MNLHSKTTFYILVVAVVTLLVGTLCISYKNIQHLKNYYNYSYSHGNEKINANKQNLISQITDIEKKIQNNTFDIDLAFKKINKYARDYNLKVEQYSPSIERVTNNIEEVSTILSMQGSYIDILNLIYHIEFIDRISFVKSVNVEKKFNRKNSTPTLQATIFLRNTITNL